MAETRRSAVGWQIVNAAGNNIHGEPDDPFILNSFDILTGEAAKTAKAWAADNPGYQVIPVYTGDIEGPSFVPEITRR